MSFSEQQLKIFHRAEALVQAASSFGERLRSHELARAVHVRLCIEEGLSGAAWSDRFEVVDGKCGDIEHSWIELEESRFSSNYLYASYLVLDVCAVGRLPQVQLLNVTPSLRGPGNGLQYTKGPNREDIRVSVLRDLLRLWGEAPQ